MKPIVWFVALLALAALGLTVASTELAGNQLEAEEGASAYQWAELSDDLSNESFLSTSEAENEMYKEELMELKSALNIDSLLQGSGHNDGEHDAALLEMEMTSALSPEATPADFFRFARTHTRLYASEKAAAAAFAAFKINKKAAAEMNAEFGITNEQQAVFAATGPLATMSPQAFKSKILTSKNPRGRGRNKRVRLNSHPYKGNGKNKANGKKDKQKATKQPKVGQAKPQSKPAAKSNQTPKKAAGPKQPKNKKQSRNNKKQPNNKQSKKNTSAPANGSKTSRSRKVKANGSNSLQPAQQHGGGHAAGLAGSGAGQSGKTGGQSGGTGGQSGKTGGKSGKSGGATGGTSGKSGKTGGETGGTSGKSGKTGGGGVVTSSIADGTIALPGSDIQTGTGLSGYTDPAVAAKMGLTPEALKRIAASGGIGSETYDRAYNTLKTKVLTARAQQYNDRGDLISIEPVQVNDCGSCWAIAAQQSLQRYWTGAAFKGILSIQQLLDCARTADSKGCKGGTPMDALEYWARNIGAVNRDYPTLMVDQTCKSGPFPNSQVAYPSAGWEMLIPECGSDDKTCIGQIKMELMVLGFTREKNFQPPIAYVDASQWQNYRGGIFPPSKCQTTMEAGNHVVQIVGSGVDNAGIPYWILDNFWGSNWGESGRIRVPFGVNACGLFNFLIYSKPPPFAPAGSAQQVPSFNAAPAAYTPKPVDLQKVETFKGVLSRTSEMFAQPMTAGAITLTPSGVPSQTTFNPNSPYAQTTVVPQLVPTSQFSQGSTGMSGPK